MKRVSAVFLLMSAMLPLNILFLIKYITEYANDFYYKTDENIIFNKCLIICSSFIFILILAGLIGSISYLIQSTKIDKQELGKRYKIVKIENITSREYLTQFSLFILTAFAIPLSNIFLDFILIVIVQVLIGIVYISNETYYINPVFSILNIKLYKVEFEEEDREIFILSKLESKKLLNKTICIKCTDKSLIKIKEDNIVNEARDKK